MWVVHRAAISRYLISRPVHCWRTSKHTPTALLQCRWRQTRFSIVSLLIPSHVQLTSAPDFCCAMLCKRSLSCPSVTFVHPVKMNKHIFKNFSPLGSQATLVFPYHTAWQYSNANRLMGASNAGGVGRNRDSEPTSGFTAWCQRCSWPAVVNTTPQDHGPTSCDT